MRARSRGGYALALALCFLGVVFMLGLAYGARTSNQVAQTNRTIHAMQAGYLAEGGAQYVMDQLDGLRLPYQSRLTFATGTVVVSATDAGQGLRNIVSTGLAGQVSHTLRITVDGDQKVVRYTEAVL